MHYLDYNEKIDHGTPDFPIAFYHVDEHHSRYNMPFHWHKGNGADSDIKLVLSVFIWMMREINAGAGDVILIGEGIIHGGVPEHCVYRMRRFDLNPTLMHTDACKRYIRLISRHQIRLYNYFQAGKAGIPACCRQPAVFDAVRYPMREASWRTLGALFEFSAVILKRNIMCPQRRSLRRPPRKWISLSLFWNTLTPIMPALSLTCGSVTDCGHDAQILLPLFPYRGAPDSHGLSELLPCGARLLHS